MGNTADKRTVKNTGSGRDSREDRCKENSNKVGRSISTSSMGSVIESQLGLPIIGSVDFASV